jgi:hypothetical protein
MNCLLLLAYVHTWEEPLTSGTLLAIGCDRRLPSPRLWFRLEYTEWVPVTCSRYYQSEVNNSFSFANQGFRCSSPHFISEATWTWSIDLLIPFCNYHKSWEEMWVCVSRPTWVLSTTISFLLEDMRCGNCCAPECMWVYQISHLTWDPILVQVFTPFLTLVLMGT